MLVDVSGDEFESFMEVLNKMQHLSTSEGSQQVIDIISEQAELEEEFQVYTEAASKIIVYIVCLSLGREH